MTMFLITILSNPEAHGDENENLANSIKSGERTMKLFKLQ